MEEHLGSGGGGDTGTDNALDLGESGEKLRPFCAHMRAGRTVTRALLALLEELRGVNGASGRCGWCKGR